MKWEDMSRDVNRVAEGAQLDHPIDWWYYNAILSSPGNPVDGWAFITIYTIFPRQVNESVTALLVPPSAEPINLSRTGIPPGGIKVSEKGCDVAWENSWCRGAYPNWNVHFEGKVEKQSYQVDLDSTADVSSLFLRYDFEPSFFNHFVVLRHLAKGTVTLGNETYPVTGYGYYEHVYGVFDFMASRGWYWHCVPATDKDRLAINMGLLLDSNYDFPVKLLAFTADGKNFHHFDKIEFSVLEEKEYLGQKYPFKFRMDEPR
jgi:hypothetical protein